jgi:hypothetical protein
MGFEVFQKFMDSFAVNLKIFHGRNQTPLKTGVVPQDWKAAHVVPLFKKDERHLACNYIPVSLTSITCKVMEYIIHSSVMRHFRRRWCGTLSNAFANSRRMISICESLSIFDAISWMVTMSWESHDRFLRNPCWALVRISISKPTDGYTRS